MDIQEENRSVAGETKATITIDKNSKKVAIEFALPARVEPTEIEKLINLSLRGNAVHFVKVVIK